MCPEKPNDFVHLHLHTENSLLDGINKISELPTHIKNIGQHAIVQTDHGTVAGSYRFFNECKKVDVKPIIGMEAYYTVNDRTIREKDDFEESYYHLILIALNNTGLHNLFKLSSRAYTEGMYRKPRLDDQLLAEYSEGLCATTACLGSRVSQLILRGHVSEAETLIQHHREIFNGRLLIELQLHEGEQQIVNEALMTIASKHNYPLVLTNDCHFMYEADKQLHELALCIQSKGVLSDPKRFSFGDIDVHIASHDWMWERAQKQGIPYEAISNTVSLANMVDSDSYFSDIINRYTKYKHPTEELTSWELLTIKAQHGLYERFHGMPPQEYRERLDYELKSIKKMGFADYMLVIQELLDETRKKTILWGPGRGSSAGSLVSYALGITQLDPIKYKLLFSRLNKAPLDSNI